MLATVLLCLAACGTTTPKQYYLLTPAVTSVTESAPAADQQHPVISVGPVTLPEYLDRSQIVTRRSDTELDLADGQRWAEPLRENFTRVLVEDLRALMGADKVLTYPAREVGKIDYRVTVDVTRFDADSTGQVTLIAVWTLHDGAKTKVIDSRRAEYTLSSGPGYPAQVATLSETIGLLSKDILSAIPGNN